MLVTPSPFIAPVAKNELALRAELRNEPQYLGHGWLHVLSSSLTDCSVSPVAVHALLHEVPLWWVRLVKLVPSGRVHARSFRQRIFSGFHFFFSLRSAISPLHGHSLLDQIPGF